MAPQVCTSALAHHALLRQRARPAGDRQDGSTACRGWGGGALGGDLVDLSGAHRPSWQTGTPSFRCTAPRISGERPLETGFERVGLIKMLFLFPSLWQ